MSKVTSLERDSTYQYTAVIKHAFQLSATRKNSLAHAAATYQIKSVADSNMHYRLRKDIIHLPNATDQTKSRRRKHSILLPQKHYRQRKHSSHLPHTKATILNHSVKWRLNSSRPSKGNMICKQRESFNKPNQLAARSRQ